jgi:hypothetical protein
VKSVCKNTVKINLVVLAVLFFVTGVFGLQALGAKPKFGSYELKAQYKELFFPDFDGDGLDDIIAIDEPNLVFFFQDTKHGFAKNPDLVYSLGLKPSVIWPAKLENNPGQIILVMTNDGISILTYVDKNTPPARKKIINQQTIIPEKCENSPTILFTLSANTAKGYPLIFVPTENELKMWKYENQWLH